jgi:hypothetical protein
VVALIFPGHDLRLDASPMKQVLQELVIRSQGTFLRTEGLTGCKDTVHLFSFLSMDD